MGGRKRAKRYFEECLAPVQLDRFDPPMAPDAAILVSARGDGFIPASEAQALHDHWPGSELRWLDTFHVAAGVMHSRAYHSAIEDAFANLGRRG
jgi:hypothetical protein